MTDFLAVVSERREKARRVVEVTHPPSGTYSRASTPGAANLHTRCRSTGWTGRKARPAFFIQAIGE